MHLRITSIRTHALLGGTLSPLGWSTGPSHNHFCWPTDRNSTGSTFVLVVWVNGRIMINDKVLVFLLTALLNEITALT